MIQHVDTDSDTRPQVETNRGRAAHSFLAPQDGRQQEPAKHPYASPHLKQTTKISKYAER